MNRILLVSAVALRTRFYWLIGWPLYWARPLIGMGPYGWAHIRWLRAWCAEVEWRGSVLAFVVALPLALGGCAQLTAATQRFEARAAPVIARACGVFRSAEANPLVQTALAVGSTAATAASGVPVGAIVASLRSFGERFCAEGPAITDATAPEQQAAWLLDVAQKMLAAANAGVRP